MAGMTFWYSVVDDGDQRFECESRVAYTLPRYIEAQEAAEEAAADYWNSHDGWEGKWPKTFVIYGSESGHEIHRFDVHMEAVPDFSACPAVVR